MDRVLVVEPGGIVGEDLADCIVGVRNGLEVVMTTGLTESIGWLSGVPALASFISSDALRRASAEEIQVLQQRGGRLFVLGARYEGLPQLDLPFTPESVSAALHSIEGPAGPS